MNESQDSKVRYQPINTPTDEAEGDIKRDIVVSSPPFSPDSEYSLSIQSGLLLAAVVRENTMHIVDGALADSVVIGGAVLAVAGIAYGLRRMDLDRIPQMGV